MPLKEDYIRESISYLKDALSINSSSDKLPEFKGYVSLAMDLLHDFENEYRNPFEEKYPLEQPFKGVDDAIDLLETVRTFQHRKEVRMAQNLLYEAMDVMPEVQDKNQLQINF